MFKNIKKDKDTHAFGKVLIMDDKGYTNNAPVNNSAFYDAIYKRISVGHIPIRSGNFVASIQKK